MKRPLLWMMVAYVSGIVCYQYKSRHIILVVILFYLSMGFLIGLFILPLLRSKWKGKTFQQISKPDSIVIERYFLKYMTGIILCLLPIFFSFGYMRMNQQTAKNPLEKDLLYKMEGSFTGTVDEIAESKNGNAVVLKDVQVLLNNSENSYNCNRAIVYISKEETIKIGNLLSIQGSIYPLMRASNPGQFDSYNYYKAKNICFRAYGNKTIVLDAKTNGWKQKLYELKQYVKETYDRILPKQEAGILDAMLLGENALLSDEIKDLYQKNGISHILAISGLHMSFFGLSIYKLLRKARCSINLSTVITILLIYLYGVLTNNSISTKRSICMLIVMLLATIVGKTYDILSAVSFSIIVLLVEAPMQLYQAGFLLSYGAILGIAIIYPVFQKMLFTKEKEADTGPPIVANNKKAELNRDGVIKQNLILRRFVKYILEGLAVSLSVQIFTFPFITMSYFEFSPYSVLLNLIVIPLVSVLFPVAVFATLISPFSLALARICMGGAYYILKLYELICKGSENLPFHMILMGKSSVMQMVVYFACVAAVTLASLKSNFRYMVILYVICPIILVVKITTFSITVLDVGQGECIVVQNKNGNAYMIDGGSSDTTGVGENRMIPYLKAKKISTLECVIVTHGDSDHTSGILELLNQMEEKKNDSMDYYSNASYHGNIRIKTICLPENAKSEEYVEDYMELVMLAVNKGVQIIYFEEGEKITDGDLQFTCLAPEKDVVYADINAHSQVFYLNYREFDALLTGDADAAGLLRVKQILEEKYPTVNNIELFKAAHHGSRYSIDKELFQYMKPIYSVISSGRNNSYGHPHEETLIALQQALSKILQTKDSGAITFYSDGKQYIFREHLR